VKTMGLGTKLSKMTKPELEELEKYLNLTEDEEMVFKELARGKSRTAIADKCLVSASTISNRIKNIETKMSRFNREGV
jgi:DNA-binding NarL/FixJ family response regulator